MQTPKFLSRVLAAAGGIGAAAIMLCIVAAALIIMLGDVPSVSADHKATSCNMVIRGELYPVTYLGDPRQNPDGTFYPGDAFYYLFTWQDRSLPDECGMRPPVLKTEGLQLNHTGVLMGAVDTLGGFKRAGTAFTHSPQDSVAVLGEYHSYFGAEGLDRCRVSYAKPGESWNNRWVKYKLHGEPFLVKTDDSRLDYLEQSKWNSKKRSDGTAEYWVDTGKHSGIAKLPACSFDDGAAIGMPGHVDYYGRAPGGSVTYFDKMIFVSKTYVWEYRQFQNSTHPHQFDVKADPGSRDEFDARVAEACGSLGADSGCMYGTATITPPSESCLYAEIERMLGEDWLNEPDKDGDGINDNEETEEDGPPPLYLPPGISAEQYTPPTSDVCIPPDNVMLEAELKGHYWTPRHRVQAGIEYPIPGIATVVADKSPPMQDPTLHVFLSKPPLRHMDGGYDAKNADGSYYHDDPIHIKHEPSWKWRDDRYKHINFTIQRHHAQMPLVDDYHCRPGGNASSPYCEHALALPPAWRNDTMIYGNGDGMSVYIADPSFSFANYSYAFNITAWNVDGEAAYSEVNTTYADLVPYEPVYDIVYSYPVLADAQEYAFDDRRGIIAKYEGSLQDGVTHGERRSFINWWNASGGGHNLYGYAEFDREHVLAGGRSAPPGAEPPVLEYNHNGAQSAMFTSAGYGVLHMEWPVSEYVFAKLVDERANKTARGANYANITAQSEFQSVRFAGHQNVSLFSDAMRYPEMPFSKQVVVRSVDQHGNIQYGDAITLRVTPYGGIAEDQAEAVDAWWEAPGGWLGWLLGQGGNTTSPAGSGNATSQQEQDPLLEQEVLEGSEYLTDYIRDKVMHDTGGDRVVTESALNDTHGMTQEWTGRGQIDATVLRTSAYFADIAVQNDSLTSPPPAPQTGPGTGAAEPLPLPNLDDLLGRLAGEPETLRMSVPLDVGLSALPPTSVYISINGGPERAFHHKYYAFGGSETILINVRADGALDAERVGTNGTGLAVRQPQNFGAITGLQVNGTDRHVPCAAGCTLAVPYNETVSVTAYNEWGGEAHAVVPPDALPTARPAAEDADWRMFAGMAVLLAAGAYIMKKFFGQSMFGR